MGITDRNILGVGFALEGETVKFAELHKASRGRYRIGEWGVRRFGAVPDEAGQALPDGGEESHGAPEMVEGPGGPLLQPWTLGLLRKMKKYPIYASMADEDVLTKFITLPELTTQEVARMIELRQREYLPLPNASIAYDFSISRFQMSGPGGEGAEGEVGRRSEPGESELRVMVVGVERGTYLAYREAIADGGVILRSMETNPSALARGCNFMLGPDNSLTYALLYLGDTYSLVVFVVEGGLYYSRVLEYGLLSLSADDAGKRRAERLLRELYRSVDFFSVESRGITVDTLYLANGGSVADPGISRRIQYFLAERLSVDVLTLSEVVEQRDVVALPPSTLAGTLLIPIGLALRAESEVGA